MTDDDDEESESNASHSERIRKYIKQGSPESKNISQHPQPPKLLRYKRLLNGNPWQIENMTSRSALLCPIITRAVKELFRKNVNWHFGVPSVQVLIICGLYSLRKDIFLWRQSTRKCWCRGLRSRSYMETRIVELICEDFLQLRLCRLLANCI
jgi:hypothetical protein